MRWRAWMAAAVLVASGCARDAATSAPEKDVSQLVSQARTLDLQGQSDAAIPIFREALAESPDSFDAHYGLGRALDLAGDYAEARTHFSRAVELATPADRNQAERMLGIAWTFAGNVPEASRCFRQVFDRLIAENNHAAAAEEANELGRVFLESGNLDEAEQWYRTGHEEAGRTPDRQPWQIDLADMRWAHAQARIAARRGRGDEAHRQTATVRQLLDKGGNENEEAQYPYLLGYVSFHLGDHAAAVESLARADRKDPFILLLLAQANEKLGQPERAREYYAQVLQSSSHSLNSAFARPIARTLAVQRP